MVALLHRIAARPGIRRGESLACGCDAAGAAPSMSTREPDPDEHVLTSPEAGGKAIRGGAIRTAGYGVGLLLTAIASVFLLRHLGVVRFGQYTTVIAIVTIVQG